MECTHRTGAGVSEEYGDAVRHRDTQGSRLPGDNAVPLEQPLLCRTVASQLLCIVYDMGMHLLKYQRELPRLREARGLEEGLPVRQIGLCVGAHVAGCGQGDIDCGFSICKRYRKIHHIEYLSSLFFLTWVLSSGIGFHCTSMQNSDFHSHSGVCPEESSSG